MIIWSAVGEKALGLLQVVWKPLLLMVGGVFLAHMIWYGPKLDNKDLKIELGKQQISSLQGVVKSQNEAIENASKVSQKTFDDMLEQLAKTLDKDDDVTADLLRRILDSETPTGCAETTAYLIDQLENLQWDSRNE